MTEKHKLIASKTVAGITAIIAFYFLSKTEVTYNLRFVLGLLALFSTVILPKSWERIVWWYKTWFFLFSGILVSGAIFSLRDYTNIRIVKSLFNFLGFFSVGLFVYYSPFFTSNSSKGPKKKFMQKMNKAFLIVFSITAMIIGLISYFL